MAFGTISTFSNSSDTSVDVTTPASTASGDLLIYAISADAASVTVTWPTGFAHVTGSPRDIGGGDAETLLVGWKVANGSEGGTLTATLSVAAEAAAFVARYTGRAASSPINQSSVASDATTLASPISVNGSTITPSVNNCDILVIGNMSPVAASATVSWAPPGSYTERADLGPDGTNTWSALSLADLTQGSAAATGTVTLTGSISGSATDTGGWGAFVLALAPFVATTAAKLGRKVLRPAPFAPGIAR